MNSDSFDEKYAKSPCQKQRSHLLLDQILSMRVHHALVEDVGLKLSFGDENLKFDTKLNPGTLAHVC